MATLYSKNQINFMRDDKYYYNKYYTLNQGLGAGGPFLASAVIKTTVLLFNTPVKFRSQK